MHAEFFCFAFDRERNGVHICVGKSSLEEPTNDVYDGDSDAEGMSSGEESEISRLLVKEEEYER